jgi:diacylglycerol kinase family enzyme
MGLVRTLWAAGGMLSESGIRGRKTLRRSDLTDFRLISDEPIHLEVDGDYLGEVESVRLQAIPDALEVIG